MNDDDLDRLRAVGTEVSIGAGQVLIEPRQAGAGLFVILEGDVVVEAPEGTRELGPGAVIGERAMFSEDGTRTARVRAIGELKVLAVDRSHVEQLCGDDPELARRLQDAAALEQA
ncbi:MAG TPA: cyclic nucleotide-binding domain-containing protein [Gaiellaceae bacterium]|jgi:CRP-like cAMP-binding protein